MRPFALMSYLAIALLSVNRAFAQAQPDNYVSFNDEGGIVAIHNGQYIAKAGRGHCSEALGTVDQQTMVCLMANTASNASQPQAEIYYADKPTVILNPGGPIFDLRYLDGDRQIVISSHPRANLTRDTLYETATGKLIDKVDEPADLSTLPQWAKSPAQLADESVPMSPALTEERNAWMSKVMSQIQSIHPGMRRSDLDGLFKTEGGLSTPSQRAYVFIECPWIKIDVKFRSPDNQKINSEEDPEDIIESVSAPFLQYAIMD